MMNSISLESSSTTDRSRQLANMLELEEHYVIRHNYFTSRVTSWHRHKLLTWLLEVCEEEGNELTEHAFGTAVNIFDRFMSREARRVDVQHLQLLGCVCLFIAAKVTSGRALPADKLADYTDHSISVLDILEWECFVLATLQWDVACVQANDYLDLFIDQFELDAQVLRRTRVYTSLCLTELKFAFYPASMLAAACLLVSRPSSKTQLADTLGLDMECLLGLTELVSGLVETVIQDVPTSPSSGSSAQSSPNGQVEFEDDYDLLLNEFPPCEAAGDCSSEYALSSPIVLVNEKKGRSRNKRDRLPNQYCSYYILTPPQPSCLPMPMF